MKPLIAVEALKQAKDEHVQKLMEAYLVTHNQRRALRIQEPTPSNLVQPRRVEDPQILEGHPVSTRGEKKAWELPEGAIVLEGIPVFPQAMNKQEHPESSKDPPLELFEPLTMKKIPAPFREIKEEAASTPPAPPPSEELQEPAPLEEEFKPIRIVCVHRNGRVWYGMAINVLFSKRGGGFSYTKVDSKVLGRVTHFQAPMYYELTFNYKNFSAYYQGAIPLKDCLFR